MLFLQVIPSFSGGGAEVIVQKIVKEISSDNFNIEVIYFDSVKLEKTPAIFLNTSPRNPFAILKLRRLFKQKKKEHGSLVVHAHLTWPLYYVALASIGLNIRLVYTEHSTYNKRRIIPFWNIVERFIYNRYDIIYCISKGTLNSLKSWLGKEVSSKLTIIQNGARLYYLQDRKKAPNNDVVRLISVGALKELKGFHTVITALSLMNPRQYKYTIVGEGSEYNYLQDLIIRLNLGDVVELIGWSDNVEQYYNAADIQLIPSKWEGFSLVAVEGMSTGLPVIASNLDGLRNVLDPLLDSVCLLNDFDVPEKWAEEIERMSSQLSMLSYRWSKCSRKQAEKFKVDKMLDAYKKSYEELSAK